LIDIPCGTKADTATETGLDLEKEFFLSSSL